MLLRFFFLLFAAHGGGEWSHDGLRAKLKNSLRVL